MFVGSSDRLIELRANGGGNTGNGCVGDVTTEDLPDSEDDGTTTFRGAVTDQAELHGLLAKVRDLGTTLISVKTIDAPSRRHVG